MTYNEAILSSIISYLQLSGAQEKTTIQNRFSIWYDSNYDFEVMLPNKNLVNHEQSLSLLTDAINQIASALCIRPERLTYKLINNNYDFLQVRASGQKIEHGKINFDEGLTALTGLYEIIKLSANKNIKTKGKREVVKKYLSGVNMLAPQAGSFIYSVEFELVNTQDNEVNIDPESVVSLGRYMNSNLAIMLDKISRKIISTEYISPATLLTLGVNTSFCNNFLGLFSKESEKLEFYFDWSFKERKLESVPDVISFNLHHKEKIIELKSILENSNIHKYVDLPAYIEKYSWPIDHEKGRVYLRLGIDGKDYSCFIETDSALYERLKAEHAKKQILITLDLLITSGNKTSIDVIKVHNIKVDPTIEIDMTH